MDTRKIKEFIEDSLSRDGYSLGDSDDVLYILDEMNIDGVAEADGVSICFDCMGNLTNSGSPDTIIVSYYSDKLKHSVTLDGDISLDFESAEDMTEMIEGYLKMAKELEQSISINK